MAKKTVASLQTSSKRLTKAIKMVKSPKTGAYTFVDAVMTPEEVDEFLKKKNIHIAEYEALLRLSGGDARKLLNTFELVKTQLVVMS